MADIDGKLSRVQKLNTVFTPSAPVSRRDAFSGRIDQIFKITGAIFQPGKHVVLYGERGVGKTSLANILSDLLITEGEKSRDFAVRVNCSSDDNFKSIWTRVFQALAVETPEKWTYGSPNPDEIRMLLQGVKPPMVVVLDEYDRVDDDEALSLMADTIKALSDHLVQTKVVLVGVSDSIEDLIGEHESVKRAIEEVQMPRMLPGEIRDIVTRGFALVKMTVQPQALTRIVKLAEGLPTYAHSLSLEAGTAAIQDDRDEVGLNDVERAVKEAVNAKHSTAAAYYKAIQSSRPENLFAQVLAACALASKNQLGYFAPGAVRDPISKIMGRAFDIPAFSRHLSEFIGEERGSVLQRSGSPRNYQYRFRDPQMQPFAILAALSNGHIPASFEAELFKIEDDDWHMAGLG